MKNSPLRRSLRDRRRLSALWRPAFVLGIMLLTTWPAKAVNLIVNGTFSSSVAGWETEGTVFDSDGSAVLSDQGGSRALLFQTVASPENTVGLWLSFEFFQALSPFVALGQTPDSVFVSSFHGTAPFGTDYGAGIYDEALGLLDADFRGPANLASGSTFAAVPGRPGWTRFRMPLTVSPFTTVAFEFIDGNGVAGDSSSAIDNVDLEAVIIPEPGAGLLLAGAAAFSLFRRRAGGARAARRGIVVLGLAFFCPLARAQQTPAVLESGLVRVTAASDRSTLDRTSGVLTSVVNLEAVNISGHRIDGPVSALIGFTAPDGAPVSAGVTVRDAEGGFGKDPWGRPFFDLSAGLGNDGWQPGETLRFPLIFSRSRTLSVLYEVSFAGRVNHEPVVNAGGPYTGRAGEPVVFSGAATDPDGDSLKFFWDFGDGGNADTAQATHTFTEAGEHGVTLTVDDGRGGVVSRDVTALIIPPGNFAVAHTRVVDGAGHPLGGELARVEESGPSGAREIPVEESGFLSLGAAAGDYVWKFSADGHLPVWRKAALTAGDIRRVPGPWLPARGAASQVSVLDQTTLTAGGEPEAARIVFPAGAFAQPGEARLTLLGPQTLPLPLPFGWSPLAAFHVELSAVSSAEGSARILLAEPAAGEALTVVKFDEAALVWKVFASGEPEAAEPAVLSFPLSGGGSYAVLAGDEGTGAPVPALPGDALRAGTPQDLTAAVTAVGEVRPEERSASLDPVAVTAEGEVIFTPAAEVLPSSSWFRLAVREAYDLSDGTGLRTPDYDTTVYAYRRPAAGVGTVVTNPVARFPLRPRLLFGPADLLRADLHVDVLPPLGEGFGVLSADGGTLQTDGLRVTVPPGVLGAVSAGSMRALNPAGFSDLGSAGVSPVSAFELNIAGMAPGARLTFTANSGFEPGAHYVLARPLSSPGGHGLTPVLRLRGGASGGLDDAEPAAGARLPGIVSGGVFVLTKVGGPQGLVTGLARGQDGQVRGGAVARVEATPWQALTAPDGGFSLLAPGGPGQAAASDPSDGSAGLAAFSMDDVADGVRVEINLAATGPSVVSISPADGAVKVRAAEPVVVRFSEPLDSSGFGPAALTVTNPLGVVIQGSLSLNGAGTTATFLPTHPLEHAATYTVALADTLRDRQGLALEGRRVFTFSVVPFFERPAGAQLVIYEPGADNIPEDVRSRLVGYSAATGSSHVVAHGSAGTAEPEVPVILVNQNTGATATVLSGPDGGFANFIDAEQEDFIEAVFVNSNGTRVTVPATRQLYDDGRVGLYKYGGILEAESDGGPVEVSFEPDTIPGRGVFKMEVVSVGQLEGFTGGVLPEGEALALPGVRITVEGDAPNGDAEVSIPLDPATLGLDPDLAPELAAFALTAPVEVDGEVVFVTVDKMRYEDGRLFTNTCPFKGPYSAAIQDDVISFGANLLPGITGAGAGLGQIFVPILLSKRYGGTTINGTVAQLPIADIELIDKLRRAQLALLPLQLFGGVRFAAIDLVDSPGDLFEEGALKKAIPVQGAFVALRGENENFDGRIRAGLVSAVSDENGCYSLVAPALTGRLVTTHPRLGRGSDLELGALDLLGIGIKAFLARNLFYGTDTGAFRNFTPRLALTHFPPSPALGQPVTLQADAFTAASGNVTVTLHDDKTTVSTAVPGQAVALSDVEIVSRESVTIAPGHQRLTVVLRSEKALHAGLVVSTESSTPRRTFSTEAGHLISFGFSRPELVNPLSPSDPNDKQGPRLVSVTPRPGEFLFPGQPVTLRFDEPINRTDVDTPPGVVSFSHSGRPPSVILSPDQQTLTVRPRDLPSGGQVTMSIGANLRDLSGNLLDRSPSTSWFVESLPGHTIPGIGQGGGSALDGNVLYVLDRQSPGAVRVFDVSNPAAPLPVGSLSALAVAATGSGNAFNALDFPRDLAVIRGWSHVPGLTNGVEAPAVANRTLLAVVGGTAGSVRIDDLGNEVQNGQYLTILDVSAPSAPALVVNLQLTARPSSVPKIRWHPPFLVFLENSADTHFVSFADLQELLIGFSVPAPRRAEVFKDGKEGADFNADGDYTDPGEQRPWPNLDDVSQFMGFRSGYDVTPFPRQRIEDFDFQNGVLAVARTLSGLTPPLPGSAAPEFRILAAGGQDMPPQAGFVKFDAAARPKRLTLAPGVRVNVGGQIEERNLAFVSLSPDADGVQKLAVIDCSNTTSPALLHKIEFPDDLGLGVLQSPVLRRDGMLTLATTTHVALIDPAAAFAPSTASGLHPAVLTLQRGGGSGNFSIGENEHGLRSVALGGRNELSGGVPSLSFVSFTSSPGVVDPAELRADKAARERALARMTVTGAVRPSRFRPSAGAASTLSPPSPATHYHVLIRAPGGGGVTLPLLVESLNEAGAAVINKGVGYPPVRAGDLDGARVTGQAVVEGVDAPVFPLTAYRLSDDFTDPSYNLYLSDPVAVVRERMRPSDIESLRNEKRRVILWSEDLLRASLDVSVTGPLAAFATEVDTIKGAYRPKIAALASTLPGGYIPGSTPPPIGGALAVPGTFGTIDAAGGEFRHTTVDLELPGRRMPIIFERTATNHALVSGGFGRGWDFNYNQRAIELKPELVPLGQREPVTERGGEGKDIVAKSLDIIISDGAGNAILFENKGKNAPPEVLLDPLVEQLGWLSKGGDFYLPSATQKGVFDLMYRFPGGEMTRLTPDGTQFRYRADGRLVKVEDRYPDNHHLLDYNDDGALVRIRDASVTDGRSLRIGYFRKSAGGASFDSAVDKVAARDNHAGKICTLLDYAGRRVDFEYDDAGMLVTRLGVEVAGVNGGFAGRPKTTYQIQTRTKTYVGVIAGSGAHSSGTPLAVAQTADNAREEAVASGTTGAGGPVTIAVPQGRSAGTISAGATQIGQADGSTVSISHDADGYPAAVTMTGPGAGTAGYQITHNDRGLPETVTYPEGNSVSYEYEPDTAPFRARANVRKITRGPGPRGGGTLVSEALYDYRYNLPAGAQKDFNGNTITLTLRGDGRDLLTARYSKAGTHSIARNDFGQVESETAVDGVTTGFAYDSSTGYATGRTLGDALTTGFGYDSGIAGKLGLPTTVTPPRGAAVSMEYDARLQRIRTTRGAREERMGYDENGNVIFVSKTLGDGAAYEETRGYSQINFLNRLTLRGVESEGGGGDLVTEFTPDALFRVKDITLPGGEKREFRYDHLGNATGMKIGAYEEVYGRDLHGNMTSLSKGGEEVQTLRLDGHDRPVEIRSKTGTGGDEVTTLTYFGKGELKSRTVTGPVGGTVAETLVTDVDELGRPLAEETKGDQVSAAVTIDHTGNGGRTVTVIGPVDTTTATHDAAGRPVTRTDSLRALTLTPDGNGNVTRLISTEDGESYEANMAYNDLDHLTGVSDPVGQIMEAASLRSDGLPLVARDGRGHSVTKSYSRLGELLSMDRPEQIRFAYSFDRNRQPAAVRDRAGAGNVTAHADGTLRPTATTSRDGGVTQFNSPDKRNLPTDTTIPGGGIAARYDRQGRPVSLNATFSGGAYRFQNAKYDALGRLRSAAYGSGGQFSVTHGYDRLGPLTSSVYSEPGGPYSIGSTIRADGARLTLTYPSGVTVTETRQASGRLTGVSVDGARIWEVTGFAGAELPAAILRGGITETNLYDARRRLRARRFTGPGGAMLEDLRFSHDATDNVLVRQALAGGGRADLFAYDDANRLVRAEYGARPVFQGANRTTPAGLSGGAGFAPGWMAREYGYDNGGLDLPLGGAPINPDAFPPQTAAPSALAVPLFAASLGSHDSFLFPRQADGFDRGAPDPLGNTARARLLTRPATGGPTLSPATLTYNAHTNLLQIRRDDGVAIDNQYRPDKLLHHRKVTGGSAPGERALVWHEGRLLEEYDLAPAKTLTARYYYANDDPPVAADLRQADGTLLRVYYLHDHVLSVAAVSDDAGRVLERVRYDAWGQPVITARDEAPPRLAEVRRDGGDLLVVMSEPVLPPINAEAGPDPLPNNGNSPAQAFRLIAGGVEQTPRVVFEENAAGLPFGSVFRLTPSGALSGNVTVRVLADTLADAWNNPVGEETLTFTFGGGTVLASGPATPGATAPVAVPRSAIGNPWLWQGQWFDYDAGLTYMRARHYDPTTGQFLQRDPMEYEDSVNPYAAMVNNPVSLRDPSGMAARIRKMAKVKSDDLELEIDTVEELMAKHGKSELVNEAADAATQPPAPRRGHHVFRDDDAQRQILEQQGYSIVGEVLSEVDGRDIAAVKLPDGSVRAFYRSSGTSDTPGMGVKRAGDWEPFYGMLEHRIEVKNGRDYQEGMLLKSNSDFEKAADGFPQAKDPMLRAAHEYLSRLNIDNGTLAGPEAINQALRKAGAPAGLDDFLRAGKNKP